MKHALSGRAADLAVYDSSRQAVIGLEAVHVRALHWRQTTVPDIAHLIFKSYIPLIRPYVFNQ